MIASDMLLPNITGPYNLKFQLCTDVTYKYFNKLIKIGARIGQVHTLSDLVTSQCDLTQNMFVEFGFHQPP